MSRRLCHIVDDVNPVDETPPDVLAPMELYKSQNSNRWDEDEDSNQWDEDEDEDENEDSNQWDEDEDENEDSNQWYEDEFEDVLPFVEKTPDDLAFAEFFQWQKSNQSDEDSIKFEYNAILDFVGDLVKGSTQIVDEVLQGSEVHTEKKEEKGPPTFAGWIYLHFLSAKMDLFRQIVSEMKACKNGVVPGEKAKTILNMLPKYSWRGKAVQTLAAFAVVFGDFCVFAKFHHLANEQVLKSLAIQKGSSELLKRQVKIQQLKEIIETILQVMDLLTDESMDKLQMDENYNPIITTVVACAIEVSSLTNDKESDDSQNLSPYLKRIREQQIILEKERDEFIYYSEAIKKLQDSRTDGVEILKTKFLLNDNQPELIDASASPERVKIDVLRGKNVFLFINILSDSERGFDRLNYICEAVSGNYDYTIVWIPIVEEWTNELRNKLYTILSSFSNRMFSYVLPSFSLSVNGIKFIKANWYTNRPALVSFTQHRSKKYPFVFDLPVPLRGGGFPINSMKKFFTFHYGGEDDEWNKQFKEKVTEFARDKVLKRKCIQIRHSVHTGKAPGFLARLRSATQKPIDDVTQEINRLRSEKKLSRWALLCEYYTVVISGHGSRFLKVLNEFNQWKSDLDSEGYSFQRAFKEYYDTTSP